MNKRNNIEDVLTAYYFNDSNTMMESKVSKVPLAQLAEIKAHMEKDTKEGIELYDFIIDFFKGVLKNERY